MRKPGEIKGDIGRDIVIKKWPGENKKERTGKEKKAKKRQGKEMRKERKKKKNIEG